jgi:hypothetical protein
MGPSSFNASRQRSLFLMTNTMPLTTRLSPPRGTPRETGKNAVKLRPAEPEQILNGRPSCQIFKRSKTPKINGF